MTIHEIFNSPAVKEIEQQILHLITRNHHELRIGTATVTSIYHLLKVRKRILDGMFLMDMPYKTLLLEFNEALKAQLLEMRQRAMAMHHQVLAGTVDKGSIFTTAKCFLGYKYSNIHPIQTTRAKKIWSVLNGSYTCFMPIYEENAAEKFTVYGEEQPQTNNQLIWLDEVLEDNWSEGLDRKMTADTHLIYAFHNLWSHMEFSIFDLLWVRDFNIEINVEQDYMTATANSEDEDLDWDMIDYLE